jgi:2-polyprenyl-6-methoxyphenol hydroxylase-like FAD-dependent oxidoreductase
LPDLAASGDAMSAPRSAEIAGAGIAGLSAAAALAARGWRVRVHERGDELREIGAGISLRENGLQALEQLGAFDEATEGGERIESWELLDERRRVLASDAMGAGQRFFTVARPRLHRALANAAARAGAEIVTGSTVTAATAAGELRFADGGTADADLVVGADGISSTVREALRIPSTLTDLRYISRRALVERRAGDRGGVFPGYWNGSRRMAVSACGPDHLYVFMFCTPRDRAGYEGAGYRASWAAAFPDLAGVIERVPDDVEWRPIHEVYCRRWSEGRAALIGDAAHAMAPTLGQGACISMCSAVALASALDRDGEVEPALLRWEAGQRPVIDATQRYGRWYIRVMTRWPRPLLTLRSAFVRRATRSPGLQARLSGRPSE